MSAHVRLILAFAAASIATASGAQDPAPQQAVPPWRQQQPAATQQPQYAPPPAQQGYAEPGSQPYDAQPQYAPPAAQQQQYVPVQQQYAPPAAQQPQYAPAQQQQYAPPAAQQQQYAPAQQQYAPPAAQQPQGAPPQQRYAPPPRQAAPPPPPVAAAPAVDWYRPPESDALVPWNGNVFQKPYDSWREWRSISFGFVSRTISMPETTMESSSYGAPSATLAAAELKTSVKGAYLDLRPGGLFFGTTTMKVGTKETDLYTFGGYLGFPFAPRVLDLGIPDVQVGVILPEAFLNLSYGSIDDTAGSVDVKTEHLLLNTGLRLTGLRVTGLDCFVAELHLGMLAYDLDAITVTSTVSDPVLGDTEAIYDGTRSKFGFSVAPEFRLGVVF